MVRVAIISMLVRDALPDELSFTVRASPWDAATAQCSAQEPSGVEDQSLLVFSLYRDEFTQEGPSGPIEAKRILVLRVLPLQRTLVTFEMEPALRDALNFCATPPLLINHRPP